VLRHGEQGRVNLSHSVPLHFRLSFFHFLVGQADHGHRALILVVSLTFFLPTRRSPACHSVSGFSEHGRPTGPPHRVESAMLLLKSGHKELFFGVFADLSKLMDESALIIGSVSQEENQAETMAWHS
jgi:hypothetical protein